ncbi:MAG: DUF1552 domain-containing protein, partial [Planctomycetota bacterium]
MLSRRNLLQDMAAGAGLSLLPKTLLAAPITAAPAASGGPKRIIFFLQNQGFDPATCIPSAMTSSGLLAKETLPEPILPLEPYKERLHIISGLHGLHTSPAHSAFFGALGGYRGGDGTPPSAATIDYELSKVLPQTLLPHLCSGMDSLENMRSKPTIATLSASGAGQPIFMHSNPNHLYQLLYGGISTGDIRQQHEARASVLDQIETLATAKGELLPAGEKQRYGQFVQGFQEVNGLRVRLDTVADHLR